jgi:hypothetical protein
LQRSLLTTLTALLLWRLVLLSRQRRLLRLALPLCAAALQQLLHVGGSIHPAVSHPNRCMQ